MELDALKQALKDNAGTLAIDLFGQPSRRTGARLFWGRKGSTVVDIGRGTFRSWEADTGGSMLDAIMFAHSCRFHEAVDHAKNWLGDVDLPDRPVRPPVIPDIDADEARKTAKALRIIRESVPITATPAETYLRGRGICPDTWPKSVRWHQFHGAVFLSTAPDGETAAIQAVYLHADGTPKLEKGRKLKRSYGPQRKGAVRFPGNEGPLCLAEGPETALSVWYATGHETWAGLGAVGSIDLSPVPLDRTIIVCADDDPMKAPSLKSQGDAIRRWRREGRTVLKVKPRKLTRRDKGDFNDTLVEEGPQAVRDRIYHLTSHQMAAPRAHRMKAIGQLSRAMGASIAELLAAEENQTHCIKVDTGIGKTREAIKHAVRIADGQTVVLAVPTHKLGNELLQRVEDEAKRQKIDIRAAVWRGREAEDPETGEQMCRDIDAVRDVQSIGESAQKTVCRQEVDGTILECPHFRTCAYQAQRKRKADIWIVPHAVLFSRKPETIPAPALVIIDESFWDSGLRGVEGHPIIVSDAQLDAAPYARSLDKSADLDAELKPIRRKLQAALRDHPPGPIERNRLTGLTEDECIAAAGMEWKRKISVEVYPGMSGTERGKAVTAARINTEIPRMSIMWRELAAMLAPDGPEKSGRLSLDMIEDDKAGSRYRALRIQWTDNIKEGWQAPTLCIDATMNIDLVRAYYPNAVLRDEIRAETPYQRIVQYPDRAFGKGWLQNQGNVADIWAWSKSYAIQRGGRWLLVVQKHVEDKIRAGFKIPDFIDIAHHNNIAGRDEWKDVTGLIVVGRTQPPPGAIEKIAGAMTGRARAAIEGWYPAATELIRAKDGSAVTVEADRHPDNAAEAVRAAICDAEVMQIIGRARGTNRTAANPVEVVVLGSLPLDVEVDTVRQWSKPTVDDRMMAEGVWLESAADAARVYPDLGSREAIKKAKQRKGTIPYKNTLYGNVPNLRTVRFQRKGAGNKACHAVFDIRIVPEPETWLAEHLGAVTILGAEIWLPDEDQIEVYDGGIMPPVLRDKVRNAYQAGNLTQQAAAERIGLSRPQLANALQGRFGLSHEAAEGLKAFLMQPPQIIQPRLI